MLVESTRGEKEGGRCTGWWRNEANFWGRYRWGVEGGFWKGKKKWLRERGGRGKKREGISSFSIRKMASGLRYATVTTFRSSFWTSVHVVGWISRWCNRNRSKWCNHEYQHHHPRPSRHRSLFIVMSSRWKQAAPELEGRAHRRGHQNGFEASLTWSSSRAQQQPDPDRTLLDWYSQNCRL